MNHRTTIAAVCAGLAFVVAALQGAGPLTGRDIAIIVAGAFVAALGVFARDAAPSAPRPLPGDLVQIPPPPPKPSDPPPAPPS